MTWRHVLPIAVVLAAAGVAVALVLAAPDDVEGPRVAPPAEDAVVLETFVTPSRYSFGDQLLAEVRLTVDSTRVNPASVVSVPVFRPFQRVAPIEVERQDLGNTTVLRFHYRIQCVARECVPEGSEGELELSLGLVRYTLLEGRNVTLPLDFPPLQVVSRLTADVRRDVAVRPAAVAADPALSQVPPLEFRGGPSLLGWLLVGAAAAIVLALGGWLAWRLRPRRSVAEPVSALPVEPPLPAALGQVERSLAGSEPERRTALDELARRLDESRERELAVETRRLAWSESGPQPDSVRELAATVRERVDGKGA